LIHSSTIRNVWRIAFGGTPPLGVKKGTFVIVWREKHLLELLPMLDIFMPSAVEVPVVLFSSKMMVSLHYLGNWNNTN